MIRLVSSAYLALAAACVRPATGALITVETDLGAELELVEVEIRDSADIVVSERRSFPRSEWKSPDRFSFGVARGAADSFVVRATGYQGENVLSQTKARVRFVPDETTNQTLWLTRACADVAPCVDGMVCDTRSQKCTRITASSAPTAAPGPPQKVDNDSPPADGPSTAGQGGTVGSPGPGPNAADGGPVNSDSGTVTGGSDGGADGATTASAPTGSPISGTMIDEWHRPVSGVMVELGDRTDVTDEQGRFDFANVEDVYDLEYVTGGFGEDGALSVKQFWRVEGITRRDPALQCRNCVFPLRTATISPDAAPLEDGQLGQYSAAGRDFIESWSPQGPTSLLAHWTGPSETTVLLRRLLFSWEDTTTPPQYLAYEERTVALSETTVPVPFTRTSTTIPSFELSGRVENTGSSQAEVAAWILWADGATLLHLISHEVTDEFMFMVPSLPNASISLLAFLPRRDSTGAVVGAVARTSVHGLTQAQAGLVFALPRQPSFVRPSDGSAADVSTAFEWSDAARVSILTGTSDDRAVHILTSARRVQLSAELWHEALPAAAPTTWRVDSLFGFEDIDEATEEGFLGGLSWEATSPIRDNNAFAMSATVQVTSPP